VKKTTINPIIMKATIVEIIIGTKGAVGELAVVVVEKTCVEIP